MEYESQIMIDLPADLHQLLVIGYDRIDVEEAYIKCNKSLDINIILNFLDNSKQNQIFEQKSLTDDHHPLDYFYKDNKCQQKKGQLMKTPWQQNNNNQTTSSNIWQQVNNQQKIKEPNFFTQSQTAIDSIVTSHKQCPLCMGQISEKQIFYLNCTHYACEPCLKEYIQDVMNKGSKYGLKNMQDIRCPFFNCTYAKDQAQIQYHDINNEYIANLGLDQPFSAQSLEHLIGSELFNQMTAKMALWQVDSQCPNLKCLIKFSSDGNPVDHCPNCLQKICLKCKSVAHAKWEKCLNDKKQEMKRQNNQKTIIVFGGAGTGKSTILSTLLTGDSNSQAFKNGETSNQGMTREVIIKSGRLFGMGPLEVELIDLPGNGDSDLNFQLLMQQMNEKLTSKHIDVVIITIKSTDVRMNSQQLEALQQTQHLIENANPRNIFLCITQCDLKQPSHEFIRERLHRFQNGYNVMIPNDNVICFSKSASSLANFGHRLEQLQIIDEQRFTHDVYAQNLFVQEQERREKLRAQLELKKEKLINQLLQQYQMMKIKMAHQKKKEQLQDQQVIEMMERIQQLENEQQYNVVTRQIEKESSSGCNIF